MKRSKLPMPQHADAIFTADWHLRETAPICRTDDFWLTQWRKVGFVAELQKEHQCPVLHSGDLFHHWKPSPYLLSMAMTELPAQFHTVYGQHDLPQHNMELATKCGIYTLFSADRLELLPGVHFGQEPKRDSMIILGKRILVWHRLVWTKVPPWPNCTEPNADHILDKYSEYDVVLTGDNHKPFVVDNGTGSILVNPGSLTRQTADQENHKPRVYLWYANSNTVEPAYIPIVRNVISREHIEHKEERDQRIEAFISKLNDEWTAGLSFEDNLERFFSENEIKPKVREIVQRALDERT